MKPTHVIVRDFRGTRIYMTDNMLWHTDKARALRVTMDEGLVLCERASREWGAKCAVIDTLGNMSQPLNVVDNTISSATKYTAGNGQPQFGKGVRK